LGQVIGLCEANVPCPKCGGAITVQRAKPEHGFAEPDAAEQAAERKSCVKRRSCFFIEYILSIIITNSAKGA